MSGRFIPTARCATPWWIQAVYIDRLSVQQLQIGGPSTFAGDGEPEALTLGVPLTDPSRTRIDGQPLDRDAFLLCRHDRPFTLTHGAACRWAVVTLPNELIDPPLSATSTRRRLPIASIAKLRLLLLHALSGNERPSGTAPGRAVAVTDTLGVLMNALRESQASTPERHGGRPQVSRARVVARTLALLDARAGDPVTIEDLCQVTEVSERTLRAVFHEFFGVGPIRLLKVRQLREIRAALLRADPQCDTVTRIAARFGIWDFSQFARNYKALFGESPSRTLRFQRTESRNRSSVSWLQCASRIFVGLP
ncbi:MAG TPA: helix-turn-helix domain-containing protein [Steroidobacter sp.]|nr:helix-turn-helix domain-containing protein [Steroidobacter sp.]